MKISYKSWLFLSILSCISIFIWFKFTFPQLSFIDLSVDRTEAVTIAKEFLQQQNKDVHTHRIAAVFSTDEKTNQYLQKNIGITGLRTFIQDHDFDMFFWVVRFFKEQEKDEYRVIVSSKTGEVIAYRYFLSENRTTKTITKEHALNQGLTYLKEKFNFSPKGHNVQQIKDAIAHIDGRAVVEVSGNVKKNVLKSLADTGADIISAGALTHSARCMDISMRVKAADELL